MPTTRLPNGITNVSESHIMADLIIPDPSSVNYWYLDFNTWYPGGIALAFNDASAALAIPYPNDLVGVLSDIVPTTATGQGRRGGRVSFMTGTSAQDVVVLRTEMSGFVIGSRDVWFETTIRPRTDVLTQIIQCGITDGISNTPTNGLFFLKESGSDDLFIKMRSSGNGEVFSDLVGQIDDSADPPGDSDTVLGFHWDASKRNIRWNMNNQFGSFGGISLPFAENLEPSNAMRCMMRVQTTTAAAVTMDVDDIFIAQSRNPNGGYV